MPTAVAAFAAGLGLTALDLTVASTPFVAASFAVGQFLLAAAPSLIASAAIAGASALLNSSRPQNQSSVNVRIPAGVRWHIAGKRKVGGNVVFGGFDAAKQFWYVIVHCDSELMEFDHYELDNIPVELADPFDFHTGRPVVTNAFKAWNGGVLGQFQSLDPFFTIWTKTFSPSDPVPEPVLTFKAAFPEWTDDHKLAGTTFSIVRINAVDDKQKAQIFKWQQGAFRLGEPGLSIVGTWGRIYDPADIGQDIDDRQTWGTSTNAALIWAWQRYRPYGFENDIHDLNWTQIAAEALVCEEQVEDKYGDFWDRYGCGVAIPEDMTNAQAEQQILATCDGIVLTDSDGKLYCKTGHYEAPTVTISGARDILAMQSREIEDGEMDTSGVVLSYTDPETSQVVPAAPYRSPRYYVDGEVPNYINVTVEGCPSHNQAVRLAKAMSLRAQAAHRLAPTVGLRAHRLRRERFVALDYDADFSGTYLIYVPVELDPSYQAGALGLVPVGPDNWTLLDGEEGDKPRRDLVDNDDTIPMLDPDDVVLTAVPVAGSNGNSVRVEASFPAPDTIYGYEFYYSADAGVSWRAMAVNLTDLTASSEVVDAGGTYLVHWRTTTSGGNFSDYNDPPASIDALAFYSLNFAIKANSQYIGQVA